MNYYDAQEVMRRSAPVIPVVIEPTMDTLCECGMRYGMHRWGDYACMNQKWKPGNGQPQWLADATFKRAAATAATT